MSDFTFSLLGLPPAKRKRTPLYAVAVSRGGKIVDISSGFDESTANQIRDFCERFSERLAPITQTSTN